MKHLFLTTSLLSTLFGCVDFDFFGASTKTIIGEYQLKQWEDKETYYLYGPNESPWGAIDGTVLELGWNEQHILVLQNDDGNGGGWRIIDTTSNRISPLLTKGNILLRSNEMSDIKTVTADIAWGNL